jgi:hypothetical protein
MRKPDIVKQSEDGSTFYLGFAWSGAPATDAPAWSIERITLDPDTGQMERMYPNGDKRKYDYRMSECEEYTYSFAR